MIETVRYAKTEKGVDEIMARRNNLRGKLRTMLILTDPSKSVDALREQGARVGVQPDFLESLAAEGYIAPVGGGAVALAPAPAASSGSGAPIRANGDASTHAGMSLNGTVPGGNASVPLNGNASRTNGSAPVNGSVPTDGHAPANGNAILGDVASAPTVTVDELSRFRAAKSFMNETVVSALGLRAFVFTLRLERCSTRADLGQLMPDYEKALRKVAPEPEARVMAERLRGMLA